MIPLKLTIEGLYSYQERQTIDFADLTAARLFGIFGATGSGKSSILEAISYALYGDTERLNLRDKRNYNMMNLKSDKAFIGLDFYNYKNDLYRVTRTFKRNAKRFQEVHTPKVVFYRYTNESWVPMEQAQAEEIIGMSYQNFKRTIIIPQGQFKEFLELGAKERTKMMQDIFGLDRYDLQDASARLKKKNQSELDQIEGQLKGYVDITKEEITTQKQELKQNQQERSKKQEGHEILEERYQFLKLLKKDFDLLQKKKEDFASLQEKEESFEKATVRVDKYERIYTAFYQPLQQLKELKKVIEVKETKEGALYKKYEEQKEERQNQQKALEKIIPYFNNLDQKKAEESDWQTILKIRELFHEWDDCKTRSKKGKDYVLEVKKEIATIEHREKDLKEEIKRLKEKRINSELLIAVSLWFDKKEDLQKRFQQQEKKVDAKKGVLQDLFQEMKEKEIRMDSFEENLQFQRDKIKKEQHQLNKKKEQLSVQRRLAEHAHHLQEGDACPLCGSLEHPDIVEAKDVSFELKETSAALDELEKKTRRLQEKENEYISKRTSIENLEKEIAVEEETLNGIENEKVQHEKAFRWEDFDSNNKAAFEKKRKEANEREGRLNKKEEMLQENRESGEKKRGKLNKYQDRLKELEKEEHAKETQIEINKGHMNILHYEDYDEEDGITIEKSYLEPLREKNKKVEEQHESLSQSIHTLETTLASKKANWESLKEQIEERKEEKKYLEERINKKLEEEGIPNIVTVRKVLKQEINIAEERRKIENFKLKFEKARQSLTELKEKLGEASFSQENFLTAEEKWKASKERLEILNKKVVGLENKIQELEQKSKEKEVLEKQEEELQKRAGNLNIIFGLLKAKGFVQYASSLRLSQLCNQANYRFQRMTRNQLSLQLNENNEFEIIDYLNEGKSRSVKTLSGGQAFQVSLSLALALAESVQTHAKAEKKFFFIDEGFGTQDPESINIIFETLLHLNKENKIVGIISHVEELKDRIPKSLEIIKDAERGSLIQWQ